MTVFIAVLHLLFLTWLVRLIFRKVPELPIKKFFLPAILLKLLAGLLYGVLYHYYYAYGDTLNYFSDALLLSDLLYQSPGDYARLFFTGNFEGNRLEELIFYNQPRALFLAQILSVLVFFTGSNYWLCSLYFSFFSFLGLFYLAYKCALLWPAKSTVAAIAFLLFPSVVFWSAGINKESLVMAATGYIVGKFLHIYHFKGRPGVFSLFFLAIAIYVLWVLKYYFAAILLPVLAALLLITYLARLLRADRDSWPVLGVYLLCFCIFTSGISYLHPVLSFSGFIDQLIAQHDVMVSISRTDNLIRFPSLEPTFKSILLNLPVAVFSGLFRPGIWEASNFFQWLAALENLILIAFVITGFYIKRPFPHKPSRLLIAGTFTYIFILAALMAIAAPNFGTLVRYKIVYLPFFVFILLFNNPGLAFFMKKKVPSQA